MRGGELLALRWENVNLEAQTAFLPMTKNGSARLVPLSKKAIAILKGLPNNGQGTISPSRT
jgi:integrase